MPTSVKDILVEHDSHAGEVHHSPSHQAILRALDTQLKAATFAEIVGLLMRCPVHRERKLHDLSWMIVPPFLANQFVIAKVKAKEEGGPPMPAGFALWARVSDEVNKRFCEDLSHPLEIHPEDWSSGNNYWIMDIVASPNIATVLIERLKQTAFAGRSFKIRPIMRSGVRKIVQIDGTSVAMGA